MVRAARKSFPIMFYHIVCEGASEVFYIEKIVQFLNNNGIHPEKTFKPYPPVKTNNDNTLTDPMHLLEQAKKIKRDKTKFQHPDEIYILLDQDVFSSGEFDKNVFIRECNKEAVTPLFQQNNFEDFLVCHLSEEDVATWQAIVEENNVPMTGKQVKEKIVSIIPKYKKGSIPEDIQHIVFSFEALNKAISRSVDSNIPFKSGFVDLLRKFL